MNKKIIAVLLAAVLALSLAACGGNTSSEAPASSEAAASSEAPASSEEAPAEEAASSEDAAAESSEASEVSGEPMDVEGYLAEVEGLNDASANLQAAMQDVVDAATAEDLDAAKAALAKVREAAQPFYAFAEIVAPADYEEAHAALAGSCKELADVLVQSADMMEGILDGEDVDMDAYNSLTQEMAVILAELAQNMIGVMTVGQ